MDIHFLRRAAILRHWTFWEWVAYVALFVAALIVAADTGFKESPDVMARLPDFFILSGGGSRPPCLWSRLQLFCFYVEFVFKLAT